MPYKSCSVIILAAGFSSRMKQAKFALRFDDNRTFLEKIVEEYSTFSCKEIIVVLNSEGIKLAKKMNLSFPKNVSIILNKHPERERFFSVQTGLRALAENNFTFIQNVDNPFVDQEVLKLLFIERNKADYIVPTNKNKGGHPILISKQIVSDISEEKDYNHNLKEYLKRFRPLRIELLNGLFIKDINTASDYETILIYKTK